jgi:uncharacterized protein (TIGR02001 family)
MIIRSRAVRRSGHFHQGGLKMKKWSVVLLFAAVLGLGLSQPAAAAIEVEGDVYVGVWSKYLWRGVNLSDSRPVIQGGADLSAGGFTLSYWSNWQLKSSDAIDAGEVTETDIILDYSTDIGELLSVSVGNIWYALDGAEDTNELYLSATVNTLLSPTLAMYWDWDAAKEDGLFFTFDISHTFELMDKLALNLGALVSYNLHSDAAFTPENDYSGFHNYELSASLDYALTDQLTLSPTFIFSSGISSGAKKFIDTETVGALNLTFNF